MLHPALVSPPPRRERDVGAQQVPPCEDAFVPKMLLCRPPPGVCVFTVVIPTGPLTLVARMAINHSPYRSMRPRSPPSSQLRLSRLCLASPFTQTLTTRFFNVKSAGARCVSAEAAVSVWPVRLCPARAQTVCERASHDPVE